MAKNKMRGMARAAAIFGATLASAFWGLTGPTQAGEVPDNRHYLVKPDHAPNRTSPGVRPVNGRS